MNKTLIVGLAIAGIIGTGVLASQTVLASDLHTQKGFGGYGYERMIQTKAEVLGMDANELKNQLGEKTFAQLAEEKDISLDEFHERMEEKARARWQEMGLSEEEIQERERLMEERYENCDGTGKMGRFGGQGSGKNR